MLRVFCLSLLFATVVLCPAQTWALDSIWSLNTVDALGNGTHPNLSQAVERVAFRGVALNTSTDYLPAAPVWQVYVQGIDGATGGIALFEGFFPGHQAATLHALNVEAGDIVDVTGFLGFHNGKTNVNTRHAAVPLFEVVIVQKAAGLPEPTVIPSIADCNFFDSSDLIPGVDQYRRTGGERYQGTWCKLEGVQFVSGTWANGQTVTITDDSGENLAMLLSGVGDFTGNPAPQGRFDVVGLFDQEDANGDGDFHDGYRLWIKNQSAITAAPRAAAEPWELYR